jgi:hypothetical protein
MAANHERPVTAGQGAGPSHACAFFKDQEDEYRVLLPFTAECADCGERCLHYLDPEREQERVERLAEAGIAVSRSAAGGKVELQTWDEACLRDGRFDQEAMLARLTQTLSAGRSFGRTHLWATMEWVPKGLPGSDQLVEYESRLNPLLEPHDDIVICTYRHENCSASLVMDILRTHPLVLVAGELQRNPLYIPTERFLAELRQRRAARPGLRSGCAGAPGPG